MRTTSVKNSGFSLVELLIYATLLSVITFFIVYSAVGMLRSHSKIVLNKTLEYSGETAMNTMVREIRNAQSINISDSTFNTSPGTLSLTGTEAAGQYTITFSLQDGTLVYSKDGGGAVPLTTSPVSVTSLTFNRASSSQVTGIRILMTLVGTNGSYSKTLPLENFVVLRNN